MTVSNTTLPPAQYNGNGSTTNFSITFDYVADTDIVVTHVVNSTGVETVWTLNGSGDTGYTISGGNVVANTAPASGTRLIIDVATPRTQATDLQRNRSYSAEVLEAALDKLTLLMRDRAGEIARALKYKATEQSLSTLSVNLPTPSAGKALGWNATADALQNLSSITGVSISSFVETLLDDANAAAFMTTLGITAFVQTLLDDADADTFMTTLMGGYPLLGDSTSGRVLRAIEITIDDATTADEIKVTVSSRFNGDTFATTDDIGKGETKNNITWSADGLYLTLEADGLSGNVIGITGSNVELNESGTDVTVTAAVASNDIRIHFPDTATGTIQDIDALVDAGGGGKRVRAFVAYVTSA